jgi:hypothetical protein
MSTTGDVISGGVTYSQIPQVYTPHINKNVAEGKSNTAFMQINCGFRPLKVIAQIGAVESTDPAIKKFDYDIQASDFSKKGFWLSHEVTPVYYGGDDARRHLQDAFAEYTVYVNVYRRGENDDTSSPVLVEDKERMRSASSVIANSSNDGKGIPYPEVAKAPAVVFYPSPHEYQDEDAQEKFEEQVKSIATRRASRQNTSREDEEESIYRAVH